MRLIALIAVGACVFSGFACDTASQNDAGGGDGDGGSRADAAGTDPDGGSSSDGGGTVDGGLPDAAKDTSAPLDADTGSMPLTSSAFANGGVIPDVHSVCDGANESIPLAWSGAPGGVASYAVVMRDSTLGGSGNYHWVLYDVSTSVTSLAQDLPKDTSPDPPGGTAKQTRWSFGADTGFQGMCPIAGPSTHVYEISVYAVDVATLPAPSDPLDPAQVDAVIQQHQIAFGRLHGSYTKK